MHSSSISLRFSWFSLSLHIDFTRSLIGRIGLISKYHMSRRRIVSLGDEVNAPVKSLLVPHWPKFLHNPNFEKFIDKEDGH